MDEDIKSALLEIAAALKERNELARNSRDETKARLAEVKERYRPDERFGDMEAMRAQNEERSQKLEERSVQSRAEAAEYRSALLAELRRLNDNFETFFDRSTSSSTML